MKLLIDSDFLFGLFVPGDAHHKVTQKVFAKYKETADFAITNLVFYEIATLVSYKVNQEAALRCLSLLSDLDLTIIAIDTIIDPKAWEIFQRQTKKGTSFVDCANLAAAEYYKLDGILSFDAFYPARLRFAK